MSVGYGAAGAVVRTGRRRVVITGMGLVTCLGTGVQHVWQRLINGESGITALTGSDYVKIPSRVAGLVPRGSQVGHLDLEKFVSSSDLKTMCLASAYALVAAHEAVTQSGWRPVTEEQRCRTVV